MVHRSTETAVVERLDVLPSDVGDLEGGIDSSARKASSWATDAE